MLIENLTWPEFQEALKKTKRAIIPIGPIEQHGPHLPLGCDYIQPFEFAKKVAEKTDVFVLPAIPLGACRSTVNYPGTIPVSPDTVTNIVVDLSESLITQGIKKIVIFMGHSGSTHMPAIDKAVETIKQKYPDFDIISTKFSYHYKEIRDKVIETEKDKHAGEEETSRMLAMRPELVKMDKAVEDQPPEEMTQEQIDDPLKYWKFGVNGDATKATKEKGKQLLDKAVENVVKLLEE